MISRLLTVSASILIATPLFGDEGGTTMKSQRNHLAGEKSPYLQQHSTNPVDWYPWGEEAFAKARKENKPIFLSVGYSTCHWCHVMARESFANPDIAKVMNEHFVNIKVDREERPDVDGVYMTFVQATTGSGGWPMSVWLTPDLKPFLGGTYFPPTDSEGQAGFKSILLKVAKAWKANEPDIRKSAGDVTEQLKKFTAKSAAANDLPDADLLDSAFEGLASSFDSEEGGFGSAPKFPSPSTLDFLHAFAADRGVHSKEGAKALAMSALTLQKMSDGGIHDQLGGGFHRYSVDRFWHIPHYEKMLYDQAQLVVTYLDAAKLGNHPEFRETVRKILAYVARRMTSPDGAFYSAEDADSLLSPTSPHKTEGAFYVWKMSEIDMLLGKDAELFNYVFGVEANGNAPKGSDPHGDLGDTNTLIRKHSFEEAAAKFKISLSKVVESVEVAREKLFEAREKRPHPHLDDKNLTAWNGLMISALARAYQDLGDKEYLAAANRAADFIQRKLYEKKDGTLLRSYRDGPSAINGFAADYAFLICGLLDLYQAGFDVRWLEWADKLQAKQDELFLDSESGGYFASAANDPHILLRAKSIFDGAEPSENSISAMNLQRLGTMLEKPLRLEQAKRLIRGFAVDLKKASTGSPAMLAALEAVRSKPSQIIIAGKPDAPDTLKMLSIVREHFNPNQVVMLADGGPGQKILASYVDLFQSMVPINGKATAFVCENFVCNLPTNDPEKLKELLDTK